MKKRIKIKKFIRGHGITMQLAIVAIGGLGVAVFCSGYTVPEGCTPSVTANVENYCNCTSVGVTAGCVGDDSSDTVTAHGSNSGGSSNVGPMPFNSESGDVCDSTAWGDLGSGSKTAVGVVNGVNHITVDSGELGITSPAVDVILNNGHTWTYGPTVYQGSSPSCFMAFAISVGCLAPNTSYQAYETKNSQSSMCMGNIGITELGNNYYISSDGNGTATISDALHCPCPPYSSPCNVVVDKVWHVRDRNTQLDITESGDVVTFNQSTSSPRLTISDSQLTSSVSWQ